MLQTTSQVSFTIRNFKKATDGRRCVQRASAVEMGVPPEMVYNALNQSQLLELDDRTFFHLDRAQPLHWKQLVAGALPS